MPKLVALFAGTLGALAVFAPAASSANALGNGIGLLQNVPQASTTLAQYVGPGSGTGTGRFFGPGSGTGMGRCRPVRVRVCRGGYGDGRGPRCYITRQVRCARRF